MFVEQSDRRNGALRPSARPPTASARRLQERGYQEWCENNMPRVGDYDSHKTAVAYLNEKKKRRVGGVEGA